MLQFLPYNAKQLLTQCYTYFLHSGTFPHNWNNFRIFSIRKPGKSPLTAEDYWPIALSCVPRKVFKQILSKRLQFYLERNNIWPRSQFGLRKGYSTTYNAALLTTEILLAYSQNQALEALFLDVHQAYDSVIPEILFEILSHYAIPSQFRIVIYKLIINRTISLYRICNNDECHITSIRLPQGSSLRPGCIKL